MTHAKFQDNVITNDRTGRRAKKSTSVWGIAFYAYKPWPKFMCIQDYDAVPKIADGKNVIRFDVENGFAIYEVIGRCEYGAAYHGKLMESSYDGLR